MLVLQATADEVSVQPRQGARLCLPGLMYPGKLRQGLVGTAGFMRSPGCDMEPFQGVFHMSLLLL